MSRECGIDCRRKNPKLRDIDHHQHDQTRLPYSCLAGLSPAI